MNNLNITLSPKQKKVMNYCFNTANNIRLIIYGGSAAGGKTWLGCFWIIYSCLMYPESRWLIGRKHLNNLKKTTVYTLLDLLKKTFKMVEGVNYIYNKQDSIITIKQITLNGKTIKLNSEIILKELKYMPSDPEYTFLQGHEYTGCYIDEFTEIDEKCMNVLFTRIRHKLTGINTNGEPYNLIPKILGTCNPLKNWVYEKYYKSWKEDKLPSDVMWVQSKMTDNPFLPKSYVDSFKNAPQLMYQKYYLGNWDYADDLNKLFNYDWFQSIGFNDPNNNKQYYLTIDYAASGNDNTIVILWHGMEIIDFKQWCNNPDYPFLNIKTPNEILDTIINYKVRYNINGVNIVIDTNGVGLTLYDQLRINGINTTQFKGQNSPIKNNEYKNLRQEMYFYLSENKIYINKDIRNKQFFTNRWITFWEAFNIELGAIMQNDKSDSISLISKQQVKQLIGHSPDIADAVSMRIIYTFKTVSNIQF